MTFTKLEISKRPAYVAFIKYGENHVIVTTVTYGDIECIEDQIFAEKFFGGVL